MKRIVKEENPLFTLRYYGHRSKYGALEKEEILPIYASDLRSAEIGEVFNPTDMTLCGDYEEHETLKIVFKDDRGVCGLFRKEERNEYAEVTGEEKKLVWFELH